MPIIIVRYRVKADRAEENIAYIEKVFAALEANRPDGVRYASMVAEDGVSFTHIASIETGDRSNPLAALPEFGDFTADIAARCEEPPAPARQTLIGGYRAF